MKAKVLSRFVRNIFTLFNFFPGPGHIQAQTVQSQDPQEHAESLRANSGMEY